MTHLSQFPGYGGGPGSPLGSSPRSDDGDTDNLAVASLILGILGCGSGIGAILGIVALRRLRVNGGRGRGAAIAGIVAFPLWLVIGAAVALATYIGHLAGARAADGAEAAPSGVNIQEMRTGQCINETAAGVKVRSITVVPCTQPHDGEVVFTRTLSLYDPTDAEIKRVARAACKENALPRIRHDPDADLLAYATYYPTAAGWRANNDHGVACVAVNATDGRKLGRPLKIG